MCLVGDIDHPGSLSSIDADQWKSAGVIALQNSPRGIGVALAWHYWDGWVGTLPLGGKPFPLSRELARFSLETYNSLKGKRCTMHVMNILFWIWMGEGGLWMDYITISSPHLLHHIYATPHMLHKAQMVVSSVLLSHFLFGMKHVFNCIFLYTVYRLLISIWLPFPISPGFVKKPKLCQHSAVCNLCNQTDLVLVSV